MTQPSGALGGDEDGGRRKFDGNERRTGDATRTQDGRDRWAYYWVESVYLQCVRWLGTGLEGGGG